METLFASLALCEGNPPVMTFMWRHCNVHVTCQYTLTTFKAVNHQDPCPIFHTIPVPYFEPNSDHGSAECDCLPMAPLLTPQTIYVGHSRGHATFNALLPTKLTFLSIEMPNVFVNWSICYKCLISLFIAMWFLSYLRQLPVWIKFKFS